jgi:pyruvate/2-oxoglutarate dehydrogenase complex dihydrolipoamide dehydrogenase (E3) component
VSCVQNPLVGTEFETLAFLEPQINRAALAEGERKRVLVIGAGVSGVEAARVAAGLGHLVEVWEKAGEAGGQMPLALAAPDKMDVAGVWTYRIVELHRLGVPIHFGQVITVEQIRRYQPDMVFVATGARPREFPMALDVRVPVRQAWDVLLDPQAIARGAAVTIIGGGIVGIETADLLVTRGCRVTVLEILPAMAAEMARNNRFEVLSRLERAGATLLTEARIEGVADGQLVVAARDGIVRIDPGDAIVLALGAVANRDVLPAVQAAGAPYVLVGDCNQPGDFLTAIRDASMAALALDRRFFRRGDGAT